MPLEYPYEYNGLVMHDQAARDALGQAGTVLPARALRRRTAEKPCIPCLEKKGLRVRPRGLRRTPLFSGDLYQGVARDQAGDSAGITHFPFAGVHVVEAGRIFNNGRSASPPSGVTQAVISGFEIGGNALLDYQQAASYSAAVDSTVGLTAADLGLDFGRDYFVLFSYKLAAMGSAVPRVGWHNTTLTDTSPVINTGDDLLNSDAGFGIHYHHASHTVWPTALDEWFVRAFHVGAGLTNAGVVLDQIYFLEDDPAKRKDYYAGQQLGTGRGTLTFPDTDSSASNLSGSGPPNEVLSDDQITDTPDLTEVDVQFYGAPRTLDTPADDRVLFRSQLLLLARTTDVADPFGRNRTAVLASRKNGGTVTDRVNPISGSYGFCFLDDYLDESWDFGTQDAFDYAAYTPAGGVAGVDVDWLSLARAPAPTPTIVADPVCGTTLGVGQTQEDGFVHWLLSVEGPLLHNLSFEYALTLDDEEPTFWSNITYEGGGVWNGGDLGDFAFDPVTDVGTWTLWVRGLFVDDTTVTGQVATCEMIVGESDPPYPVEITCPSGPQLTNVVTISFVAIPTDGFSVPDHYTYSLDGGAAVTVASSPFTLAGLATGSHTICVESWDAAGNHSDPACCTFSVEAPQIGGLGLAARDGCGVTDLEWGSLNGEDWWIRVLGVDGLWDADVRDERYPRPGRSGEKSFDDFYGGKPITVTAEVRGRHLAGLRQGQRAVQMAFSDLGSHRFYFRSWIDSTLLYVCARKNQPIAMVEAQTDEAYRRSFVVTLRADDPRAYSVNEQCVELVLGSTGSGGSGTGHWRTYPIQTAETAGGNPLRMRSYNIPGHPNLRDYPGLLIGGGSGTPGITAVNAGTAETYPVTRIYGPMAGPLILANITTGEQIVWDADMIIAAGQFLQIDHGFGEITRNGIAPVDATGLDVTQTDFWPLEPGDNSVALLAFSQGDGAHAVMCWKNAYR